MTGEAVLERCGVGHAGVIAALHGVCFDDAWGPAAVAEVLAMPGVFAVLAMVESQPIGFAVARVAADEAEIITIGVVPERRRAGVGGRLLAAAIEAAGRAGAARVFLEVAADGAAARALYGAFGFAEVGRRPGYYRRPGGARVDALVLARAVDAGS